MISSYAKNNLGEILLTYIKCFRYPLCVELGVLDGYSTSFIAQGLKINKERWNIESHLYAYDLWDLYPYKHGNIQEVEKLLAGLNLLDYVSLLQGDAFEVANNFKDKTVHFLHVDISNDGRILKKIMEVWDKKIYQGGCIAFEGGSQERDEIEWMRKYNKLPIKLELESNPMIKKNYIFATYLKWPSITILYKKFDYV